MQSLLDQRLMQFRVFCRVFVATLKKNRFFMREVFDDMRQQRIERIVEAVGRVAARDRFFEQRVGQAEQDAMLMVNGCIAAGVGGFPVQVNEGLSTGAIFL